MQNLHFIFDWHYKGQKQVGDIAKFCGLLRMYELYKQKGWKQCSNYRFAQNVKKSFAVDLARIFNTTAIRYYIKANFLLPKCIIILDLRYQFRKHFVLSYILWYVQFLKLCQILTPRFYVYSKIQWFPMFMRGHRELSISTVYDII